MTVLAAFACLLPAIIALLATSMVSWRLEQGSPRQAVRDGILTCAIPLLALTLAGLSAGRLLESLKVALFSLAFVGFVVAAFLLLVSCRARPAAAQAAGGVLVALVMGSIFLAGPVLDAAPLAAKEGRGELLMQVNPYV